MSRASLRFGRSSRIAVVVAVTVSLIVVITVNVSEPRIEASTNASVPYETDQPFSAVVRASSYVPNGNPDGVEVSMPDAYMKFAMLGLPIAAQWNCYKQQTYFVDLHYFGVTPTRSILNVPVLEAGPWNHDDGYVMPEACGASTRRAPGDPGSLNDGDPACFTTQLGDPTYPLNDWHALPMGLSEAEAAYSFNFNKHATALGQDQFCRNVNSQAPLSALNGAGIDLSKRAMALLTDSEFNVVDVRVVFKWQTGLTTREAWPNTTRTGAPSEQQTNFYVSFDWGASGVPGAVDNFAVKWTNRFHWDRSATSFYCFYLMSDDESNLFIGRTSDPNRPWEAWEDGTQQVIGLGSGPDTMFLSESCVRIFATLNYNLKVRHVESTGSAGVWLTAQPWDIAGQRVFMVSEYFPNRSLANHAPCVKYSPPRTWVSFALPVGTPPCAFVPGSWPRAPFPSENWSSRHLGLAYAPVAGTYQFTVSSDDGVRLFVDNTPLIDAWFDGLTTRTVSATLGQGWHTIRIERYQNTGIATLQFTTDLQGDSNP